MANDGFTRFSMHSNDEKTGSQVTALVKERSSSPQFAMQTHAKVALNKLDPETAAKQYLQQALSSQKAPHFISPKVNGNDSSFKAIGTKSIPAANVRAVKFRQYCNRVPVYGSLVTVELDENNELVSINSNMGQPNNVDSVAGVSPKDVLKTVEDIAGKSDQLSNTVPQLYYFFDESSERWRLVYAVQDVPVSKREVSPDLKRATPRLMDFIIDAHSGKLVEQNPRTAFVVAPPISLEKAADGLGVSREFSVFIDAGKTYLRDETLNVETYDFGFAKLGIAKLPGKLVAKPWEPAAVSAHANACQLAKFLREVLQRNGIDDLGGAMMSTVNCVDPLDSPDGKQWANAYWDGEQMVYGQVNDGPGKFRSFAVGLDIVAHEMFHGVTDKTSRLVYSRQSGALNESYSDIFGIIVSNWEQADLSKWNWEIGEQLNKLGDALRDFVDPKRYQQPAHMIDYQVLPNNENGDYGGVHINSGIHNHAAYLIMTAKDSSKKFLFDAKSLAQLFHYALTEKLSFQAKFIDSRNAIVQAGQTLFRTEPTKVFDAKIKAIEDAFDAVGIK